MGTGRRPLIAGNWKMNGLRGSVDELRSITAQAAALPGCDLLVCPPATLIMHFAEIAKGSSVRIGGQDCHPDAAGAFTGDLSAEMLADAGASAVIVGHSERRIYHGERDRLVQSKAQAAHRAGLTAIICIGETRAQRDAGETLAIIGSQLESSLPEQSTATSVVVAYEPVWAIGTGLTPTPSDVREVHAFIRGLLAERFADQGRAIRILYGGSVKPSNAGELLGIDEVDGALVGGASLKASDFLGIARASEAGAR